MPRIIGTSNEYQTKLEELLNRYLAFCKNNLTELEINYEIAFNISTNINNVLRFYFEGNIKTVYENIYELFEKNIKYLFVEEFDNLYDNGENKLFNVYRSRYSDKKLSNIEEMFQIPFDQRYKVDEQRFSIKGIPCLYLGSTPYVCFKEIRQYKKDNDKFYTSRFQYKKGLNFKILNLATHFQDIFRVTMDTDNLNSLDAIAYGKISQEEYLKKTIYTFPIQCACSFLVEENERNFKIEYAVPQIIMNCIKSFQIDGVSYCSTKFDEKNPYSVYLMTNFSIPAYSKSNELYSEKLSRIFEVTEPLCFEDFLENKPPKPPFYEFTKFVDLINHDKNLGVINSQNYIETDYYQYEKELENKPVHNIPIIKIL